MSRSLTVEDRVAIRRLSRRSNARAFLTLALDWGGIVLAAALAELTASPWVYALAVVAIARQMNALFELHHHAMHANFFTRKAWNRSLELLYSLPLGVTRRRKRQASVRPQKRPLEESLSAAVMPPEERYRPSHSAARQERKDRLRLGL